MTCGKRVNVLDPDGQFVCAAGDGVLKAAVGIAFSPKGEAFIADEKLGCVIAIRGVPGSFKTRQIGSFGYGHIQFNHPRGTHCLCASLSL